jgi:hypothetical protein
MTAGPIVDHFPWPFGNSHFIFASALYQEPRRIILPMNVTASAQFCTQREDRALQLDVFCSAVRAAFRLA